MSEPLPGQPDSGTAWRPETDEAKRRWARRAEYIGESGSCGPGTTPYIAEHWLTGEKHFACLSDDLSYGVVYAGPFLPAALAELLFPSEWTLFPWGPDQQ